MARKTFPVEQLRRELNAALSHPTLAANIAKRSASPEDAVRAGVCLVLDAVLQASGNYNGFRYLDGWPEAQNVSEHRRTYLP